MNLAELARRLAPYLPVSSGSGSGGAPVDATYLVLTSSPALTNERYFTTGNGLTFNDGGPNANFTVSLQTPGTLTVATTNVASGSHTHAITSSANPGAAAAILASDSLGNLQLTALGLGIAPGTAILKATSNTVARTLDIYNNAALGVAVYATVTSSGIGLWGDASGSSGTGVVATGGTGYALQAARNNSGGAVPMVYFNQQHASDSQTVTLINGAGTGLLLDVQQATVSKLSVSAAGLTTVTGLKIATGATVAGQVWTATDTVGNGAWSTGGWVGNYVRIIGDTMTGPLIITPSSNSTAVLKITNALNTVSVFDVDTTNNRVGINKVPANHTLNIGYGHIDFTPVPTTGTFSAATNGAGVLSGNYRYYLSYVTAEGETPTKSIFADINGLFSQQVRLTIPTGLAGVVTSRKIYRTVSNSPDNQPYILATVADNTTTTYDDNTADGGLGAAFNLLDNTTAGKFYFNNSVGIQILTTSVIAGLGAAPNSTGGNNVVIGKSAGAAMNTVATSNVLIGTSAGAAITSGIENVIVGSGAGSGLTTGSNNILIGLSAAGANLIAGAGNIIIGRAVTFSGDFSNSIALGKGLTITASNQMQVGGYFAPTNDVYLGEGYDTDNSVSTTTIQATSGRGTDKAGWHTKISGGKGTGTGLGGNLLFATSPASTTASTKNAPVTRVTIDSTGLTTFTPPLGVIGVVIKAPASQSVDNFEVQNNSSAVLFAVGLNGGTTISQAVQNAATPNPSLTITGAAHTAITASTEVNDINLNLARNVQWATGALATQRAVRIQAPTYRFVGASTITDAVTLEISGAPIVGTNATITNAYALRVVAGLTQLQDLKIAGGGTPASGKVWTGTDAAGNGNWAAIPTAAPVGATYVCVTSDATLTNERILTQGDGLTLSDAGAGGALTFALTTPGTLTVSTSNSSIGNHTHAITSSANPGAAAAILASAADGSLLLTATAAVNTFAAVNSNAGGTAIRANSSSGSGIAFSGASADGDTINATATTGRVAYFSRSGTGGASKPVVYINAGGASDAQTALNIVHNGTGNMIDAGNFSVLNDGFTLSPGRKRVPTQFDKVNATLANVTGLSVTLKAGRTYTFRVTLFVDSDPTGGFKVAMAGTATATAIIYQIAAIQNGSASFTAMARQTALGGSTSAVINGAAFATVEGTITVNAAGTLTCQFAQNSASGTSSVLVGSYMEVNDVP